MKDSGAWGWLAVCVPAQCEGCQREGGGGVLLFGMQWKMNPGAGSIRHALTTMTASAVYEQVCAVPAVYASHSSYREAGIHGIHRYYYCHVHQDNFITSGATVTRLWCGLCSAHDLLPRPATSVSTTLPPSLIQLLRGYGLVVLGRNWCSLL